MTVLGGLEHPVTLGGALRQLDANSKRVRSRREKDREVKEKEKNSERKPAVSAVKKLVSSTGRGCENILVHDPSSVVGRTCKNLAWVGGASETKCVLEMNRNRHTQKDRPVLKIAITAHTQRSCPRSCSVLTGASPHTPFKLLYRWSLSGKSEYSCYLPMTTVDRYICLVLEGGTGHHHRIARLELAQEEEGADGAKEPTAHSMHSSEFNDSRVSLHDRHSPRASPIPIEEEPDAPPPPKTALSPQCTWAVRPTASLPSSIHPPQLPLPQPEETSTVVVDINASELFGEGGPLQGIAPPSAYPSHKSDDISLHASDLHTSPASKSNRSYLSEHLRYNTSAILQDLDLTQPDASCTSSAGMPSTYDTVPVHEIEEQVREAHLRQSLLERSAYPETASIDVLSDTLLPQDLYSVQETASSVGSPQPFEQTIHAADTCPEMPYRELPRHAHSLPPTDASDGLCTSPATVQSTPPRYPWQRQQSVYPQLMPSRTTTPSLHTETLRSQSPAADVFKPQLRPCVQSTSPSSGVPVLDSPPRQGHRLFVNEVQTVNPLVKSPVKILQPSFLKRTQRSTHDETVVIDATGASRDLKDMDSGDDTLLSTSSLFARTPLRLPSHCGSLNTSRALSEKYNITPISRVTGYHGEVTPPQPTSRAHAQSTRSTRSMRSPPSATSSSTMSTPITALKMDVTRTPLSSSKRPTRPPPKVPTPQAPRTRLNVSFGETLDPPPSDKLLAAVPDMGPADRLLSTAMKALVLCTVPEVASVTPSPATPRDPDRRSPPRPISVLRGALDTTA